MNAISIQKTISNADFGRNPNIPVNRICAAMGAFQNGWITSKETQKQIDTLNVTLLNYHKQKIAIFEC